MAISKIRATKSARLQIIRVEGGKTEGGGKRRRQVDEGGGESAIRRGAGEKRLADQGVLFMGVVQFY